MKIRIRTTEAQRTCLSDLRARFGEIDFVVAEPAYKYRQHGLAFAAFKRKKPEVLLIVRPELNGSISLRRFCSESQYGECRPLVLAARKQTSIPILWNPRELSHTMDPDHWYIYLSPAERRKYERMERIRLLRD